MEPTPVATLYGVSLAQGPYTPVSARKAARYVESPFSLYCDLFAPSAERDPLHPYQRLLFALGQEHESKVVEKEYPEAIEEPYATMEESFRKALADMARGVKAVHGAPLIYLPHGMYGKPDLLERREGRRSTFGNYYYEVVEIKYVKQPKKADLVQSAFYTRLLGFVQGITPQGFHIETSVGQRLSFKQHDYDTLLDEALAGVRRILAGEIVVPCYGACRWPWERYANRLAVETQDVSLIAGVGPKLQASLKSAGFSTVHDVAKATPAKLIRVEGIGRAKAEDFHVTARAILSRRPIRRSEAPLRLPQKKCELFLDLEATDSSFVAGSLSTTNYLIGVVSRERGVARYQPFFAQSPDQEEKILHQFCEYLASLDDYIIYHWHHYERTKLEQMLNFYDFSPRAKARILEPLVDLHPIATKAFAFPAYGSGLKPIAGCLGFKWRQDDVDALMSVVLYRDYVDSQGKKKDAVKRILAYNEDDCRAVLVVKDWLVANRDRQAADGSLGG